MIREIDKPKIEFEFGIDSNFRYYYDEENREYFLETKYRTKCYFNLEGNFHRIGKPAIEFYGGIKQWRENGKMNRLDGPSHISNSHKDYWINDDYYTKTGFAIKTNHLICKNCGKFCKQECFI